MDSLTGAGLPAAACRATASRALNPVPESEVWAMQGPGVGVTPQFLSDAAAAIAEALDILDVPSAPGDRTTGAAGAAYGHAGLGAAVAGFDEAARLASGLLVEAAESAVTGLRADARSYAAREREALGVLMGAGGGVGANVAEGTRTGGRVADGR